MSWPSESTAASVAVVGLGAMGSRIAGRLLAAGHDVTVWNRTAAKMKPLISLGAAAAPSPAAAAQRGEVVLTMVSDARALREVTEGPDGVIAAATASTTIVQMSTVGLQALSRLASVLPSGVGLLDAPVLGSVSEAESGSLMIFVGGPSDLVARWTPLLRALGAPMMVGALGAGTAAKLVANATLFGVLALLGEALALATRLGLPLEREEFATRLRAMGVPATAEQVVTSAAATARYLASDRETSGPNVLVVGGSGLRAEIERAGLTVVPPTEASTADVVVVGGHDGFDYAQLAAATRAVRSGAALYATGRDAVFPTREGLLPATGAVLASIDVAAGTTATVIGKPEPFIFEIARDVLDGCRRVAVVGDHLVSDVVGAKRAGLGAILVLTGTATAKEVAGAGTKPDLVVPSLSALVTGRRAGIEQDTGASAVRTFEIERCTHEDFLAIHADLDDFWGDAAERIRHVHYPMFVHEFGDTACVVRDDGRIVAYLFGFWSQTEPAGYVHLVAVRKSHQGHGIGRRLYERFEALAKERGCSLLRAVTTPGNAGSIEFHRRLGFSLLGKRNEGEVPVDRDYAAPASRGSSSRSG
jgi:HAD superfamily hydrolase (TIGR01450 family)